MLQGTQNGSLNAPRGELKEDSLMPPDLIQYGALGVLFAAVLGGIEIIKVFASKKHTTFDGARFLEALESSNKIVIEAIEANKKLSHANETMAAHIQDSTNQLHNIGADCHRIQAKHMDIVNQISQNMLTLTGDIRELTSEVKLLARELKQAS